MDWLSVKTKKNISIVFGTFVWVVGSMISSDYTSLSYLPVTYQIVVFVSAMLGAFPGLLWFREMFLGRMGHIVIGAVIGVVAILNRRDLVFPFIGGMFIVEMMFAAVQILLFRQAMKRKGKQGFRYVSLIRYQNDRLTIIIFPPIYRIREAMIIVRLWLIQFCLTIIVLKLLSAR